MTDYSALGPDMHLSLGLPEAAPPAADQDLLDRLLDSRLDPASVPSGYGELARLLAALTAPATPKNWPVNSERLPSSQQ
jgi:hypothetical protein